MSAQVEYRGYTIRFSENEEKWRCWDIEFGHEKLSKVKERIDKMHLQLRKASSVDCLVLEGVGSHDIRNVATFHEGKIVEYLRPERAVRPGTFERVGTGEIIDHHVAVVSAKRGDKASRRTQMLSNAYALEAADMLPAIHTQQKIIREAEDEIKRIRASMPRIQFEQLADLVRASEHVFSEGQASE